MGLVLFTTATASRALGYVAVILGFTWAERALPSGQIVSPPDALAVTSSTKEVRPSCQRLIMVLEGESLVNDASSTRRPAVLHVDAATTGTFSPIQSLSRNSPW